MNARLFRIPALILAILLSGFPAHAQNPMRVVSIADGDTLTVVADGQQIRVRLKDIDAPELGQPFGERSKRSLAELCFGQPAMLEGQGQDRYGRTIARVVCAGTDANIEQVRRGYAWTFTRYAPAGSPLHAMEAEARAARRGLWSDPYPIAPWDWRRKTAGAPVATFADSIISLPQSGFPLLSGDKTITQQ